MIRPEKTARHSFGSLNIFERCEVRPLSILVGEDLTYFVLCIEMRDASRLLPSRNSDYTSVYEIIINTLTLLRVWAFLSESGKFFIIYVIFFLISNILYRIQNMKNDMKD